MASNSQDMHVMQLSHSHQLCGIVAHVKDRSALCNLSLRLFLLDYADSNLGVLQVWLSAP